MTYIDKDKALNLDFRINVNLFESRRKTAERAVQAYVDAINAIPTADVRPVVKAEWLPFGKRGIYGMMYACSSCRAKYDGKTNFCPNCGAMMEES